MEKSLIAGIIVIGGIIAYIAYKKKVKKSNFPHNIPYIEEVNIKSIDGSIIFKDVVGWFKNIPNLNKKEDTPFVADATFFKDMLKIDLKQEKKYLFIGVYNEHLDSITNHLLLEADSFDEETAKILGNEPLIVLN